MVVAVCLRSVESTRLNLFLLFLVGTVQGGS